MEMDETGAGHAEVLERLEGKLRDFSASKARQTKSWSISPFQGAGEML
jgi:hypothetical protein